MKINKKKVPAKHRGLQEMLAGGEKSHSENLTLERNTHLINNLADYGALELPSKRNTSESK